MSVDVVVRPAVPQDAAALARVHVETWRDAYRGLVPDDYLRALDPEQRAVTWRERIRSRPSPDATVAEGPQQWVAVAAGTAGEQLCGFATLCTWRLEPPELPEAEREGSRNADALQDQGELAAIYVHPHWQGRGVGAALLATADRELRASFEKAGLWVLEGNQTARRFYERQGWRPDGVRKIADIGGAALPEIRYVRDFGDVPPGAPGQEPADARG